MARQPDPDLEDRILNAARRLWKKGAGKALTMRAVARAARTNTPAVYRRFPRRDDILRALLQQTRQDVYRQFEASSSVEEACDRYLDYALSHPHEYELYYMHEYELLFSSRPVHASLDQTIKEARPSVNLVRTMLAAQLGGAPEDYTLLQLSLWALLHGTVMLLIAKTIHPEHAAVMRVACRGSVEALLREAGRSAAK
jgi:AcrR family transcriptional regulator